MNGVVGLHVGFGGSRDQSVRYAHEFGGAYAVVLNDAALCKQLEDNSVVGIYRIKDAHYDDDNAHQHFDPEPYIRLADYNLRMAGVVKRHIHYANEVGNQDRPLLRRRLRRAIEVAHELGVILVVLNIAYRNWTLDDWDYFAGELALIKQYGYFVGVHEGYSWELTTLATAYPESIGRFIESQNKYGFKVIVTEFAASLSPHDGWSEWLTETEWLSLLRQAVDEVYAPRSVPVCLYTLYPWQRGFDYHGDNAKYFRAGVGQLNAAFPLVTPTPPIEPEPVPVTDYYDMMRFVCPPNGGKVRLFGLGDENCQCTQEADGWILQRKNELSEEFQVTSSAVKRGADTSSLYTWDGLYKGFFYIQYTRKPDGSLDYGADWCPRFMRKGDRFVRNAYVVELWHDGRVKAEYPATTTLTFDNFHASFTDPQSGITLKNVMELSWGGEERYYYAEGFGLVRWWNVRENYGSWLGTLNNVSIRPPVPHVRPRPVVPFPPPGVPPVSNVVIPPVLGDAVPMTVNSASGLKHRADGSTSATVLRVLVNKQPMTVYPTTAKQQGGETWVFCKTATGLEGWSASAYLAAVLPPETWSVRIDIPYVSQLGSDANLSNNDCRVATYLMLQRHWFGVEGLRVPTLPTVNDLTRYTRLSNPNPPSGLTFMDVQTLAQQTGFDVEYVQPAMSETLVDLLDDGKPVSVLVDYSKYNPNGAAIAHEVVVHGYSEGAFLTSDPYLLGANVRIAKAQLETAMKSSPGNSVGYQAFVLKAA